MVERGNGGAIVNVSSQASKVGLRDHLVYCSSKGAVDQATRVMALELGKHQVCMKLIVELMVIKLLHRNIWEIVRLRCCNKCL